MRLIIRKALLDVLKQGLQTLRLYVTKLQINISFTDINHTLFIAMLKCTILI